MPSDRQLIESQYASTVALAQAAQQAREREKRQEDPLQIDPYSRRIRFDRTTIQLTEVEFRIVCLLASRPYRAYTPREIAQAASTDRYSLDEADLDMHISSLRTKLGFFHDYIQSVPYVGYRFKE